MTMAPRGCQIGDSGCCRGWWSCRRHGDRGHELYFVRGRQLKLQPLEHLELCKECILGETRTEKYHSQPSGRDK